MPDCPVKREKINEKKALRERNEREKITRHYSEVNGLPPFKVPTDLPSEELLGAKMRKGIRVAPSLESVGAVASGYQEESFGEMLRIKERGEVKSDYIGSR